MEELICPKRLDEFNAFKNRGKPPYDYENQLLINHEERIHAILDGEIIPPYEVEIQPSSLCNLDCKHCFGKKLTCNRIKDGIGKKEIETLAKKIDEFRKDDFKVEVVKFCGTTGEPLVNPVTTYAIPLFKDLGKKVILFTNGLFLDRQDNGKPYFESVLGADNLVLSLDAGSEETFERLKGRKGFKRIINSLEKLLGKRNSELNVSVGYVIGAENYKEIVSTTRLMRELGVDDIRFRVDFTNKDGDREYSHEIVNCLRAAEDLSDENFKAISIYSENEIAKDSSAFDSSGRRCFNQHFWACIGPDAQLYACGHRTYQEVKAYGSLLEDSFEELWAGTERLKNLRGLPDDKCVYCSPSSSRRNTFLTFLQEARVD